jgi:hypothetical protein
MELYTAWWPARFKRVIGRLSKNGKVLEDIFTLIPYQHENGYMSLTLSHVDSAAFSVDKNNMRIVYNIKKKTLEFLRPLEDFKPVNVKHLIEQYKQVTASILISEESFGPEPSTKSKIIV